MTNRLAAESSPYLLQHRHNPVDWYPWGDEAFHAAKRADRPIMVSIGYSTCHWCHVMAHESFEDPATAEILNANFVSIKVDREELPDVDALYMDAVIALTGHGGWPMTVFLTPDGRPFFAGTYFPNRPRGPMISFTDLLGRIITIWTERRGDVLDQAEALTRAISQTELSIHAPTPVDAHAMDEAAARIVAGYDRTNGGFGHAPKFPHPLVLDLALQIHARTGEHVLLDLVAHSATAMAAGGIYDQIGGGFARYSVDARWDIPHFEKMLYDQALLIPVFTHLWQITAKSDFAMVVDETVGYVLRELTHPDGGFLCAQDADSDGAEGTFYLWSADEVRSILEPVGSDICEQALAWWNITEKGNFEGRNVLRCDPGAGLARPRGVQLARRALFEARENRNPPGLDDKVVTEWNALMIAALAEAARVFDRSDWLDAAVRAADFATTRLIDASGRLMRSWRGSARHLGYASDHAASLHAYLALARSTGRARWIELARTTADAMMDLFRDDVSGGLFSAGDDAPGLISRNKDTVDTATPSSNSLAARSLLELSVITGDSRYETLVDEIIGLSATTALTQPMMYACLLSALEARSRPSTEIVITGDRPDLVDTVDALYLPSAVLVWGEPYESPLWAGRIPSQPTEGRAYVCQGYSCDLPCDDVDRLRAQLARAAT